MYKAIVSYFGINHNPKIFFTRFSDPFTIPSITANRNAIVIRYSNIDVTFAGFIPPAGIASVGDRSVNSHPKVSDDGVLPCVMSMFIPELKNCEKRYMTSTSTTASTVTDANVLQKFSNTNLVLLLMAHAKARGDTAIRI